MRTRNSETSRVIVFLLPDDPLQASIKMLLVEEHKVFPDGGEIHGWGHPGGGKNKNKKRETREQTAIRELREESGHKITEKDLTYAYSRTKPSMREGVDSATTHVFFCFRHKYDGELRLSKGETEIHDVRWWNLEDVPLDDEELTLTFSHRSFLSKGWRKIYPPDIDGGSLDQIDAFVKRIEQTFQY